MTHDNENADLSDLSTLGFTTRAIHAGQEPDPRTGAVVPAIYQTSTYKQDGVGGLREGYEYSRSANPTRTALEECIAALEGGAKGFAFASGLAGSDTVIRSILRPGEHMVIPTDAYGGTYRLVDKVTKSWGVEYSTAPIADVDAVRAAVTDKTKLIWVETPTNPKLGIADITALAAVAHEAGALLVVDNTFASPALQQPLSLGADVVVHSTTKYLGGHSDVLGGALVVNSEELAEKVGFLQFGVGAVSGAMDAWLTVRGIKTLDVRVARHSANAQSIAEKLVGHPKLEAVYYPGLPDHPGHDIAARQMSAFGGMISVAVKGGADTAKRFAESMELFQLAESLGGVESLVCYPSEMTHASVRGTDLEVPENVVRLSVGIEDVADLTSDVLEGLDKL